MSRSKDKLRLFIAAYPPEETARKMLALLDDLQLPDHRRTPLEQLHLTVHFVGSVQAGEVDRIDSSIRHAIRGTGLIEVTPVRLIRLPERGRARLIAVEGTASPSLAELHRRLVTRLAETSQKKRSRPYLPHFTLCRFSAPEKFDLPETELGLPALPFEKIRLMESRLTPSGAIHEELGRYGLD